MTLLTETQLKEIEARANAATRGPWRFNADQDFYEGPCVETLSGEYVAETAKDKDFGVKDVKFIAHSRTDIPALLAMIREQERLLGMSEEALENECSCSKENRYTIFSDCAPCIALRELREIRKPTEKG